MKQEFWHTTTLHIKLVALVSSLFHKKVQMRDLKHPDIGIFGSCGIKWNENSDMTLHHIIILSIYTYRTKHKVYKWNCACLAAEIPSCHSCGIYYSELNMRPNFYYIKMAIAARMALTRYSAIRAAQTCGLKHAQLAFSKLGFHSNTTRSIP